MSAKRVATPPLEIVPLGEAIGAEVRGAELSALDTEDFERIHAAWLDHLVLLFRDQNLSIDQHVAFSRRFGELQPAPVTLQGKPWLDDYPDIAVMSNIVKNGQRIGSLGDGEAIWHTDMSYKERPPSASLLYAREIPADGSGNTGFANMYRAYEELPDAMRSQVDGLTIVHDESRNSADEQRKGYPVVTDPSKAPGARHPAVRVHPETGRRALFLGRRRNAFVLGCTLDESENLLDELWEQATRATLTWHHHWRLNDLLMWDNRCTLHRRDSFDASLRRIMHRTQVKGGPVH